MDAVNNRPPPRLRIEIAAILVAKAVVLTAIYLAFFSAPASPPDVPSHVFSAEGAK
jgi:hypothetical protein